MKNTQLGIVGKIESVAQAKIIVRVAAAVLAFNSIIGIVYNQSYIHLGIIIVSVLLALSNSRIIACIVFLWASFDALVTLVVFGRMIFMGSFERFYLPILCLIILWLQYRAIRATFFLNEKKAVMDIQTAQDVFE